MWQIFALVLTVLGSTFIYLSNKHQGFIKKPVAKVWRVIGYLCTLCSLVFWLQTLVVSSAVFIWLFTSVVALIIIPLISLNKSLTKPKEKLS
jgi:fatty acid desaturase